MNSNKVFAAEEFRTEFTGCRSFSNHPSECLFSFTRPVFSRIDKAIQFKTVNHRAAFWLGFSVLNYSECPSFWPTFKGSAAPKVLFQQYFSKEIDLGDGALQREKDAPFALAFFAGEGLFYEVLDIHGHTTACKIIFDAAGPNGEIASLLKVTP
jgi:hypothetical protein